MSDHPHAGKIETGLDALRAMIRGELPHPPIADTIPMRCVQAEHGRVVFEATASDAHFNPHGVIHGGFAATVIDTITGCAIFTTLAHDFAYGTIDLNVKMLKAIPVGKTLIAEGEIISTTRRLSVANGIIRDDADEIYTAGNATCMLIGRRKARSG